MLDVDPSVTEELVLRAAQADPLGTPGAGATGVVVVVGSGAGTVGAVVPPVMRLRWSWMGLP